MDTDTDTAALSAAQKLTILQTKLDDARREKSSHPRYSEAWLGCCYQIGDLTQQVRRLHADAQRRGAKGAA